MGEEEEEEAEEEREPRARFKNRNHELVTINEITIVYLLMIISPPGG